MARLALALSVLATGCTGASERCEPVSPTYLAGIEEGLMVTGDGSLRNGQAVRSEDYERVWFVAAEIDGSGIEGNDVVGVWATNGDPSASEFGLIFAVDAFAREFSDWGTGEDLGLSMSDDGASEAEACV